MTEFINMWKNYVNFSARTTRKGYWLAFLFLCIASFIVGFIGGLIGFEFLPTIFMLAYIIPWIAMYVRRMRDAGKGWWWIFIPIGNIIMACMPSIPDDGTPVV